MPEPSSSPSAPDDVVPPTSRRRRAGAWLLGVGGALLFAVVVLPLIWPIPPLEEASDPQSLASAEDRFVDVGGIRIRYQEAGAAEASTTIILLHGFGASAVSFRDQLSVLSDYGRVIAFDRPGFGLTERPRPGEWTGENPYGPEGNAQQVVALMDALRIDQAVLVGHSAGAAVAAYTAAAYPDRIQALVLESPAVYRVGHVPAFTTALLRTPQARRIGPLIVRRIANSQTDDFIRSAYFDAAFVTPKVIEDYRRPLRARDWDMALWEVVAAPRPEGGEQTLERLSLPTLVVAGRNDTVVPHADSVRAAKAIGGADLVTLEDAGHVPHEEAAEEFANAVFDFLDEVAPACPS